MTSTILIVDDDPVQRRLAGAALEKGGHQVRDCDSGDSALDLLASGRAAAYDAMVLDLVMPGSDGIAVLKALRASGSDMPVIVQTAKGGMDVAISAMRAGAFDFLVKPVAPARLSQSVHDAIKVARKAAVPLREARATRAARRAVRPIGQSAEMDRVNRLIAKAAVSDIPVLIEGESGTGKELVARAIASRGPRASRPLVIVNCGAIPDNLVETILFGHEKGAFTGATDKHVGKFVEADGGTLFLDEIGELPLAAQVKLLRAIQDGFIEPVGARKARQVDVRLISATNRDLIAAVRDGVFREDLFYRLNVFPILTPSLRSRPEDIPALCAHFLERYAARHTGMVVPTITPDALAVLQSYDWPGNIRQLENEIFRAVVLSDGEPLSAGDFDHIAAQVEGGGRNGLPMVSSPPLDHGRQTATVRQRASDANAMADPQEARHLLRLLDASGQARTLDEVEARVIAHALEHYHGQMSEIARRLGIGRSTLYRKLRQHGLAVDRHEA